MPRPSARAAGLLLALAAAAAVLGTAPAASAETADTGVVEIPYGEPLDVRPSAGWSIDCAGVSALEGIDVVCAPDSLSLTAPFDADAGEQILTVPQRAGAATAEVRYRVRLAPPAPAEIGAPVIDLPLPVGAQSLVPLALLEISCGLCAQAQVEIAEVVPASAKVGIGPGHLAVRPAVAGEIAVTLVVTDDAGQETSAEVRLFAAAAPAGTPTGLHVLAAEPPEPAALAVGQDVTVSCLAVDAALTCAPDGTLALSAPIERPVQAALRVVDADGRQALASVTIDPAADALALVTPSWRSRADLGITVPLPPQEETDGPSVLAPLARIIQEVPAS